MNIYLFVCMVVFLYFVILCRHPIPIAVTDKDTILTVKQKITERENVPVDKQRVS